MRKLTDSEKVLAKKIAKEDSHIYHLKHRRLRRAYTNALKNRPCKDCGKEYPPYVMDFDHVRGEKKFNLGSNEGEKFSEKKILEEATKCDIVCANCHRERTYGRFK